jgi:butyrate kinase
MVNSTVFMEELQMRISNIAPVHIYANEDDVETLALNGYLILQGEIAVDENYPE